jgi:hypothetical protein
VNTLPHPTTTPALARPRAWAYQGMTLLAYRSHGKWITISLFRGITDHTRYGVWVLFLLLPMGCF